jgi:hypothetical protein
MFGPLWNMVLFLVVLAASTVGYGVARRILSSPRMGHVRARPTPQKALLTFLLGLTVAATFGLVIATLRSPDRVHAVIGAILPNWAGDLFVDVLALAFVVVVFSAMGYVFRVGRLFLYGWLIGLGNLASTALSDRYGILPNLPLAVAAFLLRPSAPSCWCVSCGSTRPLSRKVWHDRGQARQL